MDQDRSSSKTVVGSDKEENRRDVEVAGAAVNGDNNCCCGVQANDDIVCLALRAGR